MNKHNLFLVVALVVSFSARAQTAPTTGLMRSNGKIFVVMAVVVTTVVSVFLANIVVLGIGLSLSSPIGQFANGMTFQILTVFLLVPFVLRLPMGKRTFRQYMDDIGLSRIQPFVHLVLLALSCYVILAFSQVVASFVYRLSEGLPITWYFVRQVYSDRVGISRQRYFDTEKIPKASSGPFIL